MTQIVNKRLKLFQNKVLKRKERIKLIKIQKLKAQYNSLIIFFHFFIKIFIEKLILMKRFKIIKIINNMKE